MVRKNLKKTQGKSTLVPKTKRTQGRALPKTGKQTRLGPTKKLDL